MDEGLNVELASIGKRLVSCIVDESILFAAGSIYGYVFSYLDFITLVFGGLLIQAGYFTYLFGNGQTLGMKLMKIKLIGTDGTYPVGYTKGFFRWIGLMVSSAILYLGFLWILIDKNRQGWHDTIAGTYVVAE